MALILISTVRFLFFMLLCFFFYFKWQAGYDAKYLWALIASFLIGSQTDWPVYFAVPAIVLHHIVTSRRVNKGIWLLPLAGVVAFFSFLAYSFLLSGTLSSSSQNPSSLFSSFMIRSRQIPLKIFLPRLLHYGFIMYTPILIVLSGLWIIWFAIKAFKKTLIQTDWLLISLMFAGSLEILIFRELVYVHEYALIFLLPGIVIASAIMVENGLLNIKGKAALVLIAGLLLAFSSGATYIVWTKYQRDYNESALNSYRLGLSIKNVTNPSDKIILIRGEMTTKYYSDREMILGIHNIVDLEHTINAHKDYNYVLIENKSGEMAQFLAQRYSYFEKGGLAFFKLR